MNQYIKTFAKKYNYEIREGYTRPENKKPSPILVEKLVEKRLVEARSRRNKIERKFARLDCMRKGNYEYITDDAK